MVIGVSVHPYNSGEDLADLKLLDDIDVSIILALGPRKMNNLKIQKLSFLVSKMLKLKTDAFPSPYGPFSETIFEKLTTGYLAGYVERKPKGYMLTDDGLKIYKALREKLVEKGKESELKALDVIRNLPEKEILVLIYQLFPDHVIGSEIAERLRNKMIKKTASIVKTKLLPDGTVVLEIDA